MVIILFRALSLRGFPLTMCTVLACVLVMSLCVLCFVEIKKKQDKNLIFGRSEFHVEKELLSLDFKVDVANAHHICRSCVQSLKKRRGLLDNLHRLNCSIKQTYRANSSTIAKGDEKEHITPIKKVVLDENAVQIRSATINCPADRYFRFGYPCASTSSSTPHKRKLNHPVPPSVSSIFLRDQTQTPPPHNLRKNPVQKATTVEVKVEWPSKTKVNKLPESLESLGKMLCRGTYKQIAVAVWKNPILKRYVQQLFLKDVDNECASLCSSKTKSCLRSPTKSEIDKFSFDTLNKELETKTPLLSAVLRTASLRRSRRNENDESFWKTSVCMSAAVVLKNRSPYMNALQLMNSIILYHSGIVVSIKMFYMLSQYASLQAACFVCFFMF